MSNALHYRKLGHGEPLVLVHGLFGSLENLSALARGLAEHFTVYSIDLPNHGRSPHSESCSIASMAQDLSVWMGQQHLDRAHILGHSLGGKVAMELALTEPSRVERLVVADIAPVHYRSHHDAVFAGLLSLPIATLKRRKDAEPHLCSYIDAPEVRGFLLKNLKAAHGGGFVWKMNLPVLHRCYSDLLRANSEGTRFDRPVLFLKGEQSDYIQESHRHEVLARFPHAQLKVVPDAGHWLHAQKPALCVTLVLRFFQSR